MRKVLGKLILLIDVPYAVLVAANRGVRPHTPLIHLIVITCFACIGAWCITAAGRREGTEDMKHPSLEHLAESLQQGRRGWTGGERNLRHADAPPARASNDPAPETQPQEKLATAWRKPRIPFYADMGREEFPETATEEPEQTKTETVQPLAVTGEWSPGQPVLPPPPPGKPKCIALPRGDEPDGQLLLPSERKKRAPPEKKLRK